MSQQVNQLDGVCPCEAVPSAEKSGRESLLKLTRKLTEHLLDKSTTDSFQMPQLTREKLDSRAQKAVSKAPILVNQL